MGNTKLTRVKIKKRTGRDLFEYMNRSLIDAKTAIYWALEEFVTINDEPLDVVKISKLSNKAYIQLSSRVFASNVNEDFISESNLGINYKDNDNEVFIKQKPIHRDFITELQTTSQKNKNNQIAVIKHCIVSMYDVTQDELDVLPHELVGYLINKVNFFLSQLTDTRDEFNLDDVWVDDTGETTPGELDNMVSKDN